MSRRRDARPTLSCPPARTRTQGTPRLRGARAPAAEKNTALGAKPLLVPAMAPSRGMEFGANTEAAGLGVSQCDGVDGREITACGLRPAVCGARFTADGSRACADGRETSRVCRLSRPRCTPELSGIDRRAEEARLACLVHDFGRGTGTIVFRLVVPASVLFPGTAVLAVSMSSHYKR
jgi:hypothetical protein